MSTNSFISPVFTVIVLLVLAVLFLLSYSKRVQRRVAMITDFPAHRQRNLLLAAAAMCFLLINPILHAILIGAGVLLYRYLVKEEAGLIPPAKPGSFFPLELVCTPKTPTDAGEALPALRKCIFASTYIVPASQPKILMEGETYKVSVILFSEKYLNSFVHFLGESGFTTVNHTPR